MKKIFKEIKKEIRKNPMTMLDICMNFLVFIDILIKYFPKTNKDNSIQKMLSELTM